MGQRSRKRRNAHTNKERWPTNIDQQHRTEAWELGCSMSTANTFCTSETVVCVAEAVVTARAYFPVAVGRAVTEAVIGKVSLTDREILNCWV